MMKPKEKFAFRYEVSWEKKVRLCAWLVFSVVIFAALSLHAIDHSKAITHVAFGSCANQNEPQPIWDPILSLKPDVLLLIGDNIYADTEDMSVLKAKYAKLAAVPGFQKLRKKTYLLATWDDHDYGLNDAGADFRMRQESQRVFLDFFQVPKESPRRQREGVYHAEIFGPPGKRVQIIVLDTRYFRSPLLRGESPGAGRAPYLPNNDPNATVLGAAQWEWLEEQLKQPAELRLLVSSIQVVAQDHQWEKWMNFPRERHRLFELIKQTGATGIVLLTGDRHLAELSMMDAQIGYPVYDLTSSGLNRGVKAWRALELNQHRVATMNFGDNFGVVEIDWNAKSPVVSLEIRDVVGDVRIRQKLSLDLLQPAKSN
jgi:alkaline phosphatase D